MKFKLTKKKSHRSGGSGEEELKNRIKKMETEKINMSNKMDAMILALSRANVESDNSMSSRIISTIQMIETKKMSVLTTFHYTGSQGIAQSNWKELSFKDPGLRQPSSMSSHDATQEYQNCIAILQGLLVNINQFILQYKNYVDRWWIRMCDAKNQSFICDLPQYSLLHDFEKFAHQFYMLTGFKIINIVKELGTNPRRPNDQNFISSLKFEVTK